MNIKRFFANNSRDALALVRKALGPDAVILANRSVNGGNEIMALASDDMDALANSSAPHLEEVTVSKAKPALPSPELAFHGMNDMAEPYHHKATPAKARHLAHDETLDAPSLQFSDDETESLLQYINKQQTKQPSKQMKRASAPATMMADSSAYDTREIPSMMGESRRAAKPSKPQANAKSAESLAKVNNTTTPMSQAELSKLMNEMRTMRGAIESQLSELVWENTQRRDPNTSAMLRLLLASGFAPALSRKIVESMPNHQSEADAQKWIENILIRNIRAVEDENELFDQGGIFAVIGPTGVGKTTTLAKMAARYVMKHGSHNLGLITTDAYRIGGYEQLRIYGKILGVMVHSVKDEADLKIALNELKGKHTILIDTVGVNQRDSMVATQLAMLSGNHIKRLLCLNATCTTETLTDVVNIYKGKGLAGCIMTKLDEAATIGSTLDVIIREKLRLYYVTNGQRVPEDIHMANKRMLVHHAFKLNKRLSANFKHRDEELPLIMAHADEISHANIAEEFSLDE